VDPAGESVRPPQSGRRPAGEAPELLTGTVERITYADESTLYTVLRVEPDPDCEVPTAGMLLRPRLVSAVGRAPAPAAGQRVRLHGAWEVHPTHGQQFAFESLEVLFPKSAEGLVKYLASDAFEGVGETLAQRIVEKLGERTLERIAGEPGALKGVRGLRAQVAEQLAERVRIELGTHEAHAFLRGLGLGPGQSAAVLGELGTGAEAKVRADPYVLAQVVAGIGFATADRVAAALGVEPTDPRRLRAALLHVMRKSADDGHTLLPRAALFERIGDLLREEPQIAELEAALEELGRQRTLALEEVDGEVRVYLPALQYNEDELAKGVARLLEGGEVRAYADEGDLARIEEHTKLRLADDQRAAVLGLLRAPVGLLTGGPGVGKTTIVRQIVELASAAGARVVLASPTGRAAKRLAEATGREASTIHRLLGFDPSRAGFAHGAGKPLECDLAVVDEISMLDVSLARHLVDALEAPSRLLLVGDPDQLPSVGPGNVLSDLIASDVVPVFRLTRIFRQDEHSLIVQNAHRILRGELPHLPARGDTSSDFYFFPADDPLSAAERLVEVVTQRVPETFGLDWINDVQVIAPMYRGECGVDELNERLRDALGLGGLELVRGTQRWRVGDRVIQTRNDYDKEVFNGDMGRIVRVDTAGSVTVAFPEREVLYEASALSDLQPAFAITVHRAQGAEFPAVVMPLVTQHAVMLQRNLLYTAITRARKLVVLVGTQRALRMAIDNAEQGERESALAEKLRAAVAAGAD
jgi:exodeoxyribonuclease V alpha subunit